MKLVIKIKEYLKKYKIKEQIINNKNIIFLTLPFILMDISTRAFGDKINFFSLYRLVPNLFTIIWITLFIGIVLSLKKNIGKYLYLLFTILFFIFFLVNNIYYSMTNNFFDFSLLELTGEGSVYFIDALKDCNPLVYIIGIFCIALIIWGYKNMPNKENNNYKKLSIIVLVFFVSHFIIPIFLGRANSELSWNTWRNPRNIYINFNDNNKSMRVAGLYEYTFRNFYITFLKAEKTNNQEDLAFLEEIYNAENKQYQTNYTGIFKDKNLIFLQMEGIDSFLATSEIMPNLYSLLNNSINFTNHYSYYNGGGSTFNSEFAVNTGFFTPLSYTQNAYTFNKNSFQYSMANLFKKAGYTINAFHMNTSEYYSRGTNYDNWGYDNYFGLKDLDMYEDYSYYLDTELINNTVFYDKMFPSNDSLFVNYIITYSNHMPFSSKKGVCSQLLKKQEEELINQKLALGMTLEEIEAEKANEEEKEYTELDCLKIQAKETDDMIGLLIKALTDKELIDNTVIIAFTDHYLYTLSDITLLNDYKITDNNLINRTPFFIWSKDMKKTTIKEVTSQLNILPTTLNLFGIEYHPNYYIGEDALNSNYKGYVFFSDYSWYNGNVYIDGGIVTNGGGISNTDLEEKNYYINYIIRKNDLTLKYNYFKYIK